jgi:hypothetical protein
MTTMEIGIGLPSTVPGTTGPQLTGWARQANAAGCDELIFFPCSSDRGQVRMLAEAAGRSGVARESPGVTV